MTTRILIMGLPGAGKTTLAEKLQEFLVNNHKTVTWLNADQIRKEYNDWDFSEEGRIRQSKRMHELSTKSESDYVIADFVAPLVAMRDNYKADWTIWVDTIREGRYADTNKMFVEPESYDFRVNEQDAEKWAEFIGFHLKLNRRRPVFDWKKETVQMTLLTQNGPNDWSSSAPEDYEYISRIKYMGDHTWLEINEQGDIIC